MKRAIAIAVAMTAALSGSACKRLDPGRGALLQALARSTDSARRVVYAERAGGVLSEVDATIVDDFRYGLHLSVDGTPAADEFVVDDARALKVASPATIDALAAPGAPTPPELVGGGWVVDPAGAIELFRRTETARTVRDPLTSALDVLTYARTAVEQAPGISRFNADASTYRKEFDPFPRPTGGVIRYDLSVPTLPRVEAGTAGGGALRAPDERFFRRMALYVRDGRVIEFRENVSVAGILRDPRNRLAGRLTDYNITLPSGSIAKQAAALVRQLNALAAQQGTDPIRERDLDVRVDALSPTDAAAVVLPSDAAMASLTGIADHGQLLSEEDA